jgi:hypothetical protein
VQYSKRLASNIAVARLILISAFSVWKGCIVPATNFLLLELHVVSTHAQLRVLLLWWRGGRIDSHCGLSGGHFVELSMGETELRAWVFRKVEPMLSKS